jgi:hypothetical protein
MKKCPISIGLSFAAGDFLLPVKVSTRFPLCDEDGTQISVVGAPVTIYPLV